MLINKITKEYMVNSNFPNINWLGNEEWYLVADGTELAQKIKKLFPRFEFVLDDNGNLIDVVEVPKTQEEINKEREEEIKNELVILDNTINRATEDLYTLTNTTPYQKTAEVIARKEELRQELKSLEVEVNGEGTVGE